MTKKDADHAVAQIATRVPMVLLQRVKIHCVEREKTIMEFVADALRQKLRRPGVRLVVLAMSLAELLAT